MKRLIVGLAALALGLSACGSSQVKSLQSNPTAKQDAKKAEAIFKKCVHNPALLKTKVGRKAALNCAIPPQNQKAALRCEYTGLGFHIPTEPRIIKVTLDCIGRYT